jgi:hypothetical protein
MRSGASAQSNAPLENAYRGWAGRHEALGGDRNVALGLGWSKAYSSEHSSASGVARLDLIGGSLRVEVEGLGREGGDVWLIDNLPATGAAPLPSRATARSWSAPSSRAATRPCSR